jgi:hypothetical protein
MKEVRKRQSTLIEHVIGKCKIERPVTTGKTVGRQDTGRKHWIVLQNGLLEDWILN